MNLRKATIRIVLAFVSVIAVGGMIAGCSSDEFEGPKKTFATRSADGTEPVPPEPPTDTIAENSEFFFRVPDLINNDGVEFGITVSWTKGACDRIDGENQSIIRRTNIIQTSADNRFEQMYREMLFEGSETGESGLRYDISDEDYKWNENFSGITATFAYTIISPEMQRWNAKKNVYETVRDTFGPRQISCLVIDSRINTYVTSPNF